MRRLFLIIALAVLVFGCGASARDEGRSTAAPSPSATAPVPSGYSSVDGTPVLVLRPEKATDRVVLYLHGSEAQVSVLEEEQVKPLVDAFLARGFAVAASNGGGEDNWGTPSSVADSVALVRSLGYKRVYIVAQSMGGIGGVELIDRLHPVAWAGIFPACDARSVWRLGGSDMRAIEAAWGPGSPPAKISPVKAKDLKGLPVIMFSSPEDTDVPKTENADVCASWMRHRGARVTVVQTVGEHGDPSNFQPARLSTFFAQASRPG